MTDNRRLEALNQAIFHHHWEMATEIIEDMYLSKQLDVAQFWKIAERFPNKLTLPKLQLSFQPTKLVKIGLKNMKPRQFLFDRFDMEKNNLVCICGSSNAGKTIFAQYLALCVANNLPLFGQFAINNPLAPKKVLHIDYEQSELQTCRRYERLSESLQATAFNIDRIKLPQKLDDITTPRAEMRKALNNLMAGYDLIIVDSLRQSMSCDENSSQVSYVLELLKELAEINNTVILLIHHKGKNPNHNSKDQGRGSSAIYAGVDIMIDLDFDEQNQCIILKNQKNRDQVYFQSLSYKLQDGGNQVNNQRCSERLDLLLVEGYIHKDDKQTEILKLLTNGQEIKYTYLYDQIGGDKMKFKHLLEDMIQQKLINKREMGKSKIFSMGDNGQSYLDYEDQNEKN